MLTDGMSAAVISPGADLRLVTISGDQWSNTELIEPVRFLVWYVQYVRKLGVEQAYRVPNDQVVRHLGNSRCPNRPGSFGDPIVQKAAQGCIAAYVPAQILAAASLLLDDSCCPGERRGYGRLSLDYDPARKTGCGLAIKGVCTRHGSRCRGGCCLACRDCRIPYVLRW